MHTDHFKVLVISTDYRDTRKAAYQQFAVASDYNAVLLPPEISSEAGATLGVAFVTSALTLGICFGIDFSSILSGPDLVRIVQSSKFSDIPEDVKGVCKAFAGEEGRPHPGEWIAIWGGTCGPFSNY
jgi:NADPH:quinone reductase-like Zn-dependent oxidoreductase